MWLPWEQCGGGGGGTVRTVGTVRAPCWKQSTGYIPEDLQARHVKYVLNQKSKSNQTANQLLEMKHDM